MAHGLLYELISTSKKGAVDTVRILEDGYAGSDIDRNVPLNAFKLIKDKAAFVKGTSLQYIMREETDFEFLSMFSQPLKHYKVELRRNSVLLWSGWLNTQQYEADYKPAPNNVSFMAYDGLGMLKDEEVTLTGQQSHFAIIRHILDKIGLNIGYAIAIGIHETHHDTTLSPLEQTYDDCSIFEDKTAYEALEYILKNYTAEITQVNGRWEIVNSTGKKSTRLLYSYLGAYDTTQAAPTVLDLGKPDDGAEVYPISILKHSYQFGGRKVSLTYNYGLRESFLRNYLFTKYAAGAFTDWTTGGAAGPVQRWLDGENYAFIGGYSNVDTDYIERAEEVVNVTGETFVFEIDMCPIGNSFSTYGGTNSISMAVRVQVTLLVGATTYYLATTGWSTTPGYISTTITSAKYYSDVAWTNLKILTTEIPGDGTLTVRLQRYKSTAPGSGITYTGVAFHKPIVKFLDGGDDYDDSYEVEAVFDDSSNLTKLADDTVLAADSPDMPNAGLIYDNILRLSDESPTEYWKIDGNDTLLTSLQLYLKLLASYNVKPLETLQGTIKSTSLRFNNIILHAYNSNREFEVAEGTWNMYEETFDCTLVEVPALTDQTLTLSDGTTIDEFADLDVTSITPASTTIDISTAFNTTVRVTNNGGTLGSGTLQWKIVDGADVTQSSGSVATNDINPAAYQDIVQAMTTPGTAGTYYVKCKLSSEDTWQTSSAITVVQVTIDAFNTVGIQVSGDPFDAISISATSSTSVTKKVYWQIRDSAHTVISTGFTNINFTSGTNSYDLTGYIPVVTGINYDIQAGFTVACSSATSNHFDIAT